MVDRWAHFLGWMLLSAAVVLAAPAESEDSRSGKPRNLILISIDTLRADRLGCYGHRRPTSPSTDRLAAEGVLFEDTSATSPWTKPSHASIFTGLYPSRNGAAIAKNEMPEGIPHLASLLSARGFDTAALVNTSWFTKHGLNRGFEHFEWVKYIQGRRAGSAMTKKAIEWFEQARPGKPFFLFLHYMDVHSDYVSLARYERMFARPYDGPVDGTTRQLYRYLLGQFDIDRRGAEHLKDLYDAGIRQVDDQLGELFAYLRRKDLMDDSLVVLTSDHGEEFLEHGGVIHGFSQFQEVIRVPLIFRGPGIPDGKRIRASVSLVDVMPTCLDLLGLPIPEGLDGISLRSFWSTQGAAAQPRLLYLEADTPFPPGGPESAELGPYRGLRSGRFKLYYATYNNRSKLFDLVRDPGERLDVSRQYPQVTRLLRERLNCYLALEPGAPRCPSLTNEEIQILEPPH